MVKNIYKSWLTTLLGVLFALGDIAYLILNSDPNKIILITVALIGIVFIFLNEQRVKNAAISYIEKKLNTDKEETCQT